MHRKLMVGLAGTKLTTDEQRILQATPPQGVILFSRNIVSHEQLRALINTIRQTTGEDTWVAIDEEGGRIYRIPWLPFSGRKKAAEWGKLFNKNSSAATNGIYEDASVVGEALAALGFSHNCAPVLDVFNPDANPIIGDRAYGSDIEGMITLAKSMMDGLHHAGIEAVGKHFPGHGRANADSHLACPVVDAQAEPLMQEVEPFKRMVAHGLKHMMTAHVSYPAVDAKIATFSQRWLKEKLRRDYGFAGTIWSDDLCMKGVGCNVHVACEQALTAGCDLLLVCEPVVANFDQFESCEESSRLVNG